MRSRSTALSARLLEPLPGSLWIFFLIWTAVGALVMPFELGEVEIRNWVGPIDLQRALVACLRMSDALWIVLAAASSYLALAQTEGLAAARRWAVIIVTGSALLESVGALTGVPFGPYVYTDRFGLRLLGVLPFTIPLAWLTIVVCARFLILRLRPAATRLQLALGTGLVALLTDLNLEPIAWKVRAYWLWYPTQSNAPSWPPVQNYVSWFIAAAVLAWAFPRTLAKSPSGPRSARPIAIIILMNALFLLVHLVRALRGA